MSLDHTDTGFITAINFTTTTIAFMTALFSGFILFAIHFKYPCGVCV